MVERVIAVIGMQPARPIGVLGDEQDAESPLDALGDDACF
jgi:hypothetical protein